MNSQVYCFLLCIWLFSCQDISKSPPIKIVNESQNIFNLIINIEGILEGQAYLNIVSEQQLKKIDSITLIDNSFLFTGKIDEPILVWLTFDNTTQGLSLILEPEEIRISGERLHIKNARVKGGSLNNSYTAFKKESSLFFSKIDTRYQRFQKARLENNSKQLHIIHKEISDIKAAYLEFCTQYILKNPDSFISLVILNDLIDENLEKNVLQNSLNSCSKRLINLSYAQKIKQRIQKL